MKKYQKVTREDYEGWYARNAGLRETVAADKDRLAFHLMPKTGWLNDPNGLCQHNGVYHIYYQYTPFEPTGEIKLWGRCTTRDFIHYDDEGPVLFPDKDFDAHGVYSGSAFVKDDTIHYFYTGNVKYFDRGGYDYINSGRGSNTIHFTSKDGRHFTEKELLLKNADYPEDMSCHIRDPKVFELDGAYYMVLGARDQAGRGQVLLYRSADLRRWAYHDRLVPPQKFGYMWECPDVFELDGQWFLIACPQGVSPRGMDYQNVHQCTAVRLTREKGEGRFKISEPMEAPMLDRGFDFYAPQTFEDEKGRRILIAWMGIPDADYTNPTVQHGWQHALTLPRELRADDRGRLIQKPLEELKALRAHTVSGHFEKMNQLEQREPCYEAEVFFDRCETMTLALKKDVALRYEKGILTLDLGARGAGRTRRQMALGTLRELRVFADTTALEIFVNGGEAVFTTRVYSPPDSLSIKGRCAGRMDLHRLKPFVVTDRESPWENPARPQGGGEN